MPPCSELRFLPSASGWQGKACCESTHIHTAELQLRPCVIPWPLDILLTTYPVHQAAVMTLRVPPKCQSPLLLPPLPTQVHSYFFFPSFLSVFTSLCVLCHPSPSVSKEDSSLCLGRAHLPFALMMTTMTVMIVIVMVTIVVRSLVVVPLAAALV